MIEKTFGEIREEEKECLIEKRKSEERLKILIKEGRYSDARKELVLHDGIFQRYIELENEFHKKYYGKEGEWPNDLWFIPPEYRIPEGPDRANYQKELF
jgi:hypothetical protein